jgi:hypothetical protein
MKKKKDTGGPDEGIERRATAIIDLKAKDRAILEAMAKRYKVTNLVDFLEGIVIKKQGPNVVARFYDDPPSIL